MSWWNRIIGSAASTAPRAEPSFAQGIRAASMDAPVAFDGLDDPDLVEFLRGGQKSASSAVVNERTAMCHGVAFRCVTLICGVMATLPSDLVLQDVDQSHEPAVDHPFRAVLRTRPNQWQSPGDFKRMMQAHKLLRGNGYALKVKSRGAVRGLIPLVPSRMFPFQNDDLSITYRYLQRTGGTIDFDQADIFHLRGLSLDGIVGLSVISYARESLGLALAAERAGANLFRNGQFTSGYFKSPNALSDQAWNRLKGDLGEKAGVKAAEAGEVRILEEGLAYEASSLSAEDAQWLQTRSFQRSDVGMFFGVPPFLYGDTDKSTSWGTGIQQQNIAFKQYCLIDHTKAWQETFKRDCLSNPGDDPRLVVHFDYTDFLQADATSQAAYFSKALGAGGSPAWMTQDEVRAVVHLAPMGGDAAKLPKVGVAVIRDTNDTNTDLPPEQQT